MNRKETVSVLALLRAAFPAFYREMDRRELEKIVDLWEDMFRPDDGRIVAAAVKALIAAKTDSFPPSVGAVKEKVRQITAPETSSEQEAWARISKALRNGTYGAEQEFAALPEELQRVVGGPEQLRAWAAMDEKSVQSVVASNVQRSYRAKSQASREFAALPEDVKALCRSRARRLAQQEPPPEPKPLPPRSRTAEDIAADIQRMKQTLQAAQQPKRPAANAYAPISDAEWEARRTAAISRLKEVEEMKNFSDCEVTRRR